MGDETPAVDEPNEQVEKKRGPLVLILVVAVLVLGAAAAGIFLGPKLFGSPAPEAQAEPAASAKPAQDAIASVTNLPPVVVDTRDEAGGVHHVKCAIALELVEGVTSEDIKNYTPRAREAAVLYLRLQAFETLTDPKNFEKIRATLNDKVKDAVGSSRVTRVVITEFVAQ